MDQSIKKQVTLLIIHLIFVSAPFILNAQHVLASPCPVSQILGTGRNSLPYAIAEHNTYGSCQYNGGHLIYFDEDLQTNTIVLTTKQTITRSGLTIGDSVVAVNIDATNINDTCIFQCHHTTNFVNITSVMVNEGVNVFCNNHCVGTVNAEEIATDCAGVGLFDTDGDSICDNGPEPDNCITVSNSSQSDTDGDGIGSACDNCPSAFNPDQDDSDGDHIGNACDNCPYRSNASQEDPDQDGVGTACDNCSNHSNASQENGDRDAWGNSCDDYPNDPFNQTGGCLAKNDSDSDGLCDDNDALPNDPTEQYDTDGDGVGDNADNCPNVANPSQINSDTDAAGNACDSNDDGDGLKDTEDNCPILANTSCSTVLKKPKKKTVRSILKSPSIKQISKNCINTPLVGSDSGMDQNSDNDGDGILNACDFCPDDPSHHSADATCTEPAAPSTDEDHDNIENTQDNCPSNYNPDQKDSDENGIGNACDGESAYTDGGGPADEAPADINPDEFPDFIDVSDIPPVDSEIIPLAPTPASHNNDSPYYAGTPGNSCSLAKTANRPSYAVEFLILGLVIFFSLQKIRSKKKEILSLMLSITVFALVGACGDGTETPANPQISQSVTTSFFPHPKDWIEPAKHGLTALARFRNGTDTEIGGVCKNCHGEDFQGGTGRSCYTCHSVFPHPWGDWTDTASSLFHGHAALQFGMQETCGTQCHGEDFNGGLSGRACYSCHELVPHVPANPNLTDYFSSDDELWRNFAVHGSFVQENNAIAQRLCSTNCHGADYLGGLTGKSCFDCHAPYPHAAKSDNWKNDHLAYVNNNSDASCATVNGCHTNKNFGPSTVVQSCTDFCHR